MRPSPFPEDVAARLWKARVGIAGAGGMGSHVAMALARTGVGHITVADFDVVDGSNLFRQCYTPSDVGRPKVDALAEVLLAIEPDLEVTARNVRLDPDNSCGVFSGCQVVCEALDRPDQKAMLVEAMLSGLESAVVSCSGMAGFGSSNSIVTERRLDRLYVCGDKTSDVEDNPGLTAARVMVCAGHMANMVVRIILGEDKP